MALKRATFHMDRHYVSGPYLIYDCEKKHYVCVSLEGNARCQDRRELSSSKGEATYKCAPLKKFSDMKACQTKNYEVMESAAFQRFCYPK